MEKASNTNSLPIDAEDLETIRNQLPPLEHIPSGWAWVWWVLGILLLLAVLYGVWRWWKTRPAPAPPTVPAIPAHEKAKAALERALALIHDPKPFCIAVSDAVRVYLEDRFQMHAPERTTEEFLEEMGRSLQLTPDQKESLGEFLAHCDLVKFARHVPTRTELQSLHDSALRLVEETQEPSPLEESEFEAHNPETVQA